MKKFRKCFDINYNGKTFTIFVDEYHRYTFLEKNKDRKYIYPTLEDYKNLNKIYNEHNPFILHHEKKYTFKEKVLAGAIVLGIFVIAPDDNSKFMENYNWEVEIDSEDDKKEVAVMSKKHKYYKITSIDEITKLIDIPLVSIEDIDETIKNNPNLNESLKIMAHNLAEAIYLNESTADLRVYYYHLQNLEIEEMSDQEYQEKFEDFSTACYDSVLNKIYYKEGCNRATLYHELAHATYSFYLEKDKTIYYRGSNDTHALNEAFNNKIVEFITPENSYSEICKVLDYLFAFVPYDYNRYNNEGPEYILNDLKKMYPSVDIDYINDCLNAMKDSSIELGEKIKITDCEDLVSILVDLSKEKLNETDIETKIYPYKEVNSLLWDGENVYPCIAEGLSFKVLDNGDKTFPEPSIHKLNNVYLDLFIRKELIKNPNVQINNDFWKRFAIENNCLMPEFLYQTSLYFEDTFLSQEYLKDLRIQIGETENNEVGFIIQRSVTKEIIFQSDNNLKNISNVRSFYDFFDPSINDLEKLELKNILNEEYLKTVLINEDLFKNVYLTEQGFKFEPLLTIYIKNEDGIFNFNLNRYLIEDTDIYLKDVLNYYGLLEENRTEYNFAIEEINELIISYMEDLNIPIR